MNQSRKRSTKINFLGPETAGWGGGLPREGVVVGKFVPSLESLCSFGLAGRSQGCPGKFAGMSRTLGALQKVCAKKVRAHFLSLVKGCKLGVFVPAWLVLTLVCGCKFGCV